MILPYIYAFSSKSSLGLFDLPIMKAIPYTWLSSLPFSLSLPLHPLSLSCSRNIYKRQENENNQTSERFTVNERKQHKFLSLQNQISLAGNYPNYLKTHFKSDNGLKASIVHTTRLFPTIIRAYCHLSISWTGKTKQRFVIYKIFGLL